MKKRILIVLLTFLTISGAWAQDAPLVLWYAQPAVKWDAERLPVGNGRMGAMIMGGVANDTIQFNEQSLWSGDNNWDGAYNTGDHGFGAYRNFGEVRLAFDQGAACTDYRRSLDLVSGIHSNSFKSNRITYQREAFASHPDQVMVFRYTAGGKGQLSGRISLWSAQGAKAEAVESRLQLAGIMANQLKYAAQVRVAHDGGTVLAKEDQLVFTGCRTLTLYLDARTNYKPDYNAGWRGADPLPVIEKELSAAMGKSYVQLRAAHIKDFTRLAAAARIDIGTTPAALRSLPSDTRRTRYAAGGQDPDLEEILFQYGRYLLISSSRPGGLPANLQGLWNNSNNPPWASDYHNNINIQMNYWLAEPANLSECNQPLIDYIVAQAEPCRIATRRAFGQHTRGWTARTSQSIFGGNGWEWNIPASAWYAQHVYEHWAFTRDPGYLKKTAYPILKEICNYWEDRLKKLPDGTLVVPNGWSPEHGPREDGVMHDQQLVWDLFQNYLDAARALGIDADYQEKVADMQRHLAPNKIGKWGQLQEWQADRDDPDDQHRHTSHLFAVYPGRQINPTQTPELAKAAIISLRSRSGNYGKNINKPFTVASTIGDSRRSWSWPWRCAMWARLGEGEKAGMMIRGLFTYNMLPNMFTTHPPFQIDGNLGISGAIPEMLLQSHAGFISLLPAIPAAWKVSGSFKGLKARGGFTVDCSWKNGKVTAYRISSEKPRPVKLMIDGRILETTSVTAKK
ncbi:glycoside hydrolase family 95 protein [Niabella drilacis]|uniref:Alpha-L-fucosidase 2 n=1 Tax=Niabella drilacis (strain DSM 25811 / CCM 8410 / CCUG 62505 / LMG 26954 / E90) TaxID=1285928 RepID=A0A1G6R609_NIADE|nr:glycoside hydrolase family 95 protein [Niabella drilacis]SDC99978.1 alpha-L-fucosidase 2 [Niabella drilacis]